MRVSCFAVKTSRGYELVQREMNFMRSTEPFDESQAPPLSDALDLDRPSLERPLADDGPIPSLEAAVDADRGRRDVIAQAAQMGRLSRWQSRRPSALVG